MGAVIPQAEDLVEAKRVESKQKDSGEFKFDKSLEGLCLYLIYFNSKTTVSSLYKSRQSFVVEVAAFKL